MLKDRRICIVSGGVTGQWICDYINEEDFFVGADRGALFFLEQGIRLDYALGDFDSVTKDEMARIKKACSQVDECDPVAKDYTDTELAFNWALEQKPAEILLFGVTGDRLDHTLANLYLLARALDQKVSCRIIDEKNEIFLINKTTKVHNNKRKYLSLLPFGGEVTGITLEGFQYPLNKATYKVGQSIGISNIMKAETAQITLEKGCLMVIRSED